MKNRTPNLAEIDQLATGLDTAETEALAAEQARATERTPERAVAQLLGVKASEVDQFVMRGGRLHVRTTDGSRYVIAPPTAPDADGKTGVMYEEAPTARYRGRVEVFAPTDRREPRRQSGRSERRSASKDTTPAEPAAPTSASTDDADDERLGFLRAELALAEAEAGRLPANSSSRPLYDERVRAVRALVRGREAELAEEAERRNPTASPDLVRIMVAAHQWAEAILAEDVTEREREARLEQAFARFAPTQLWPRDRKTAQRELDGAIKAAAHYRFDPRTGAALTEQVTP